MEPKIEKTLTGWWIEADEDCVDGVYENGIVWVGPFLTQSAARAWYRVAYK